MDNNWAERRRFVVGVGGVGHAVHVGWGEGVPVVWVEHVIVSSHREHRGTHDQNWAAGGAKERG
jgi:hypothetical protein